VSKLTLGMTVTPTGGASQTALQMQCLANIATEGFF
jgi:hypothetical protein